MKKFCACLVIFLGAFFAFGQNTITYNGSGNYELTERTDLRRYDNGKYKGLMSREVTSFIMPVSTDNGYLYDGYFYVLENTKRNSRNVAYGVDDAIHSVFKIDKSGQLSMIEDYGFPSYRSFPTFPNREIFVGDSWEGKAERAVDPLNRGIVTKMPVYVQYTYTGDSSFNNEPVYVISAQWATRYGMGTGAYYIDWGGDQSLERATGSHKATIYVSKLSGNAVYIRDVVDETFFYNDGNAIQFKGTISLFTKYPPAIDRTKFLPALKKIAGLTEEEMAELSKPTDTFPESDYNWDTVDNSLNHNDNIPHNNMGDTGGSLSEGSPEWEPVPGLEEESTNENKDNIIWEPIDDLDNLDNLDKLDKQDNLDKLEQLNNKDSLNDEEVKVRVENTPAGIRLTIENLQFEPDSDKLLPGQLEKLEEIANVLKSIPEGRFLIEGHTASTGYEKGEMALSLQRAKTIASAFTARGLNENQFICKGSGGKKPIADNSTKAGKAKNRRVEITILD